MMKTRSLLALLMMALLALFSGNLLVTGCADDDDDDSAVTIDDDDDDVIDDDDDDDDLGCSDLTTEADCLAVAGCAWEFTDGGSSLYPTQASATPDGVCTQLDTGGVISAADCAAAPDTATFGGKVIGFVSRTGVPGLTVTLMDNATGEAMAGVDPQVTDSNGNVSFANIDKPDNCLIGIFVDAADDSSTHETYQWNLLYKNTSEVLWSVPEYLWQGGPAMAGITQVAGNAVVAGGVYWVNDNNEEEFVGCSTVGTDVGGDDAYMDATGMPAPNATQPHVHPLVGFFLIGNIPPSTEEKVRMFAEIDGNEIGETTIWAKPDTIHISNIYNIPRADTNPTPDACTE